MRYVLGWLCGFLCGVVMSNISGCVSEAEQRQWWQDCSDVTHTECFDTPDFRQCEYEFYIKCLDRADRNRS